MVLSQLQEIYEGWKNLAFPLSPKVEELAKKRINICVNCDKLNKRNFCKLCGCFMPAKVRSHKSKCLKGLW
jgi:recombinational DNA repair protein RecR